MIVASCITITTRDDFYDWLSSLPWAFTVEEKKNFANKAKYAKFALWTRRKGIRFS